MVPRLIQTNRQAEFDPLRHRRRSGKRYERIGHVVAFTRQDAAGWVAHRVAPSAGTGMCVGSVPHRRTAFFDGARASRSAGMVYWC
jgi:hypothetical protein